MGVQGAPNPLIYTANLNLRLNFALERYFYDFYKNHNKTSTFLVKKLYRRQSLQFTRENLNLRLNISWGH